MAYRKAVSEDAVRLLRMTYVDLSRAAVASQWGRILWTLPGGGGSYDHAATRREGCYLRLISIIEAYVDAVSSSLLRADFFNASALLRGLIEDAEVGHSRTWFDREKAFKNHHQIDLERIEKAHSFKGMIQTRNAIAHGVGQLTPQQRKQATIREIENVGVVVRNHRVLVSDSALSRCVSACVAIVDEIDAILR